MDPREWIRSSSANWQANAVVPPRAREVSGESSGWACVCLSVVGLTDTKKFDLSGHFQRAPRCKHNHFRLLFIDYPDLFVTSLFLLLVTNKNKGNSKRSLQQQIAHDLNS